MPFNIAAFKSNGPVYGLARPTMFDVTIATPPVLGIDKVSEKKFSFMCKAASLPPFQDSPIPVSYFGRQIKVAGDRVFAPWTVSVYNDEDFSLRAMFEKWQNGINRLVSNVRDPNLAEEQYKTDLIVTQYAKDGEDIRAYQLIGCWPTEIGAIELDFDSQNQYEMFNVIFEVDYWVPLLEESSKKAGGVNKYGPETTIDGPLGPL
jgi:hypothetical protein